MTAAINGVTVSEGNLADMDWTFAELIERASYGATLYPGDVIATGTPGGVGFARTPPVFMKPGDVVEIDIEGIGTLRNSVVESD